MENENTTTTPETEKSTVTLESLQAEIEKLKDANEKLKQANTKASADTSKYKKELQARQSEAERAEAERAEELENLRNENKNLKRNDTIRGYENTFLAMGYSAELAQKRAVALTDGDTEGALSAEKEFLADLQKQIKTQSVVDMKRPPVGGAEHKATVTAEQFARMTYAQRLKLKTDDEETYNKLTHKE